jgi:hypothetical protein
VVASVLQRLGVFLGAPAALLDPLPENPRGYWEHRGIKDLNEELLARVGGRWWSPPDFAPGWDLGPGLEDLRARARAFRNDLSRAPVWGWKDPRTCLLVPFWRPLLPSDTRYVICVRHPLDIARSLHARDDLAIGDGIRLWEIYTTAALAETRDASRTVVAYDELLRDPGRSMTRLARYVGLPAVDPAALAELVTPDLRHHHTARETARATALPSRPRQLHEWLRSAGAMDGPEAEDALAAATAASIKARVFAMARAQTPVAAAVPPPGSALRRRARAWLGRHPRIARAYRQVRRVVRRYLRLGP